MSLRRAARIDANQPEIIQAFELAGATVAIIKEPVDIAIGYMGLTVMVEIKDGSKPPSGRKHTNQQKKFFATWRGAKATVDSIDAAMQLMEELRIKAIILTKGE